MTFFVCLCLYLADYVFLCKFDGTIDGSEKEFVEEDREGCVLYGNIVYMLLIEKISEIVMVFCYARYFGDVLSSCKFIIQHRHDINDVLS